MRTFQKAISDVKTDFCPVGLQEYWENEAKQYNQESIQYLAEIRRAVKTIFANELEMKYGKDWIVRGLPKNIYMRAKAEADEQNYNLINSGQEEEEISIWDCVTLTECKVIATVGSHWGDLFEKVLIRPEEVKITGGKEAKTEWLTSIESISNKLQRATYSVSVKEFELIKSVHLWICAS